MGTRASEPNLYETLEVGATATPEEIEASYQRISSYLSPDSLAAYSLMDEDELARRRAALDDAYRTLSDPERRAAYDHARESHGYPEVLVPAAPSDATVSVGVVRTAGDGEPEGDALRASEAIVTPTRLAARDDDATTETGSEPELEPAYEGRPSATGPLVRQAPPAAEAHTGARAPISGAPPPAARPGVTSSSPGAPPPVARRGQAQAGMHRGAGREPVSRPPPPARGPSGATAAPRRLVPSPSIELTPDTEFSGALLRRLRESASATLEDLARITKVRRHYLEAIEEHAFDELPAPVYVRGFVGEYARVLGLDMHRVTQSYMALYRRYRGEVV